MKKLIIFDFDGVIADSEVLANTVLAEVVTELGTPMTLDAAFDTFMGRQFGEVMAAIAAVIGRPVADGTAAEVMHRTLSRFRADLREVPGIRQYLVAFPHVERCIASSSSADRLAACLDILGLSGLFGAHVYSAALVPRGKPHPDLFLHAARQLGVAPADTIVIEDSEGGVRAAIAAGMTPIGFLGGSHIRAGHEERLRSAGAHDIAYRYAELEAITRRLVQLG